MDFELRKRRVMSLRTAFNQDLGDVHVNAQDKGWVRSRLARMFAIDQGARRIMNHLPENPFPGRKEITDFVFSFDPDNTRVLKQMLDVHGWIRASQFGQLASVHAWTIVQHADHDPDFQEQVLKRLETMPGECAPDAYALLHDRVQVGKGLPQLYGSQFNGTEPQPIADPENVDARRLSVGLDTMAEYTVRISRLRQPS